MNKKIISTVTAAILLAGGLEISTLVYTSPSSNVVQASRMPKHYIYWLYPRKVIITKNTKLTLRVYKNENNRVPFTLTTKTLKRGRVVSIFRGISGHDHWTFSPIPSDFRVNEPNFSAKYSSYYWISTKNLNDTTWFKIYTKKSAKKYRKIIKSAKKAITPLELPESAQPKTVAHEPLPQSTIDYLNDPNVSLSDKFNKAADISNQYQREDAFNIVDKWLYKEEHPTLYSSNSLS